MDSFVDAPDGRSPENPAGDPDKRGSGHAETEADVAPEQDPADADLPEGAPGRRQRILFCATIGLICAALIALIWVATTHAINDQRAETLQRARTWVQAQGNLLTESARRELASIDQSLVMLESTWIADPKKFSLPAWKASLPSLGDLVDEYFIANDEDVIVQDTLPQAVGQGIGGAYASFGRGTLEQINLNQQSQSGTPPSDTQSQSDTRMLVGELNEKGTVRRYLMYLVRPVPGRPGWLVGASYRSAALVKVFGEGSLGARGLAALIDTRHGGVQAVAGPAAVNPKLNVFGTPMFKAFQNQGYSGMWTGPTGIDGDERIHAFYRVPGRDLVAVVGLDLHDWMAPTESWAEHARELAAMASLLVVAIGGLVLWWLWTLEANRRLRSALEAGMQPLGAMAAMRSAVEASPDGLALLGPDGRLVAWNPSFASGAGVAADALQRGGTLEEARLRRAVRPESRQPAPEDGEAAPAVDRQGFPGVPPENDSGDRIVAPPREDGTGHLVERVAERLLRSGGLDASAAGLLSTGRLPAMPGAAGPVPPGLPGGDMRGLPPGLAPVGPAGSGPGYIDLVALERAGMVDWSRTRSRVSEEFRLIQRQLLTTAFSGPNAQPGFSNLVMVTSSRPGEGKSFMALNLAGSISRQGDHSVLLIDADSKRDSFCYPLGLADAPGLLDLAANPRLDAGHCIVKTPIERLSILPVGRERERGPELFSSKEMARLIQALGRRYSDRLVVLDAPPCLSTSDPALLASVVGQVVLVVEAERTQRDEIEAAVELVEECPHVMLVLNKQRSASRFHFGAYSSYYSS